MPSRLIHQLKLLKLRHDLRKSLHTRLGCPGAYLKAIPGITWKGASPQGYPFHWRSGTSDVDLVEDIFVQQEYAFDFYPKEPLRIIDAGANIGLTSIYYKERFPNAHIVALEPDHANYLILQKNTASLDKITTLQQALWHREEPLHIANPSDKPWAYRMQSGSGNTPIPGTTIPSLMEQLAWPSIDILKIDIEGAEREVFANRPAWVEQVSVIVIELHDCIHTGCSRNFYLATDAPHWQEFRRGENIFMLNRNRVEMS